MLKESRKDEGYKRSGNKKFNHKRNIIMWEVKNVVHNEKKELKIDLIIIISSGQASKWSKKVNTEELNHISRYIFWECGNKN